MSNSVLPHLRAYEQADEDGAMVLVSRQACDEAADEIERLLADRAKVRAWMREPDYVEKASIEWLNDWIDRRPLKESI